MSRVAEALRKSRGEINRVGITGATADRPVTEPWGLTDDPWHVAEALPTCERVKEITAAPIRDAVAEPAPPTSASPEELSGLVQRLFQPAAAARAVRSVVFSAVGDEADGASLCVSAAHALAGQTSDQLCIVDANLRTPHLHATYGVKGARGLSDALVDLDSATDVSGLVTKVGGNVWLLTAGLRCDAALPHFIGERLHIRLLQLLATFEYLVIDAAPATAHADVSVLGSLVDGVVLVVEADATRRDAAKRVAGQLQAASVRMLGAVLTNRTFPIPEAIYRRL